MSYGISDRISLIAELIIFNSFLATYLDCVGVDGLLGVKGLAFGFSAVISFLAGLSLDDGGVVSFEALLATLELLLLV